MDKISDSSGRMAVDKEVEEYLEASGNPLLDDYMDPINNQYGVFNPTQEPGFINRSTMLDDIPTTELYTLVIRNIPLLLNIKGFKGLFSYYGEVQDCYLGKPARNENTTWGKVSFLSKREGAAAIESLHDQKPLRLQVSWFTTKKTKENWRRKTELEQDFDSTTRNSYDELIKRAEEKIMNINENCLPEGDLKQKSLVTDERSRFAKDNVGVEESNTWGYPLFQPRYDPHPCDHCRGKGRLVCSVCQVWYCSYKCQVHSWPIHKYDCIPPPPLMHPAGSMLDSTPINPSSSLIVSRTNSSAAKVDVVRKDESLNTSTNEEAITTQSGIVECSKKANQGTKNVVTPGTNIIDETSYPSNQEEVKTTGSRIVELTRTQDEVKELSRTQEDVKELNRTQDEVKELSRTQEDVKELNRTQDGMKELSRTQDKVKELSRTQDEVKELTRTQDEVKEFSRTQEEVKATKSGIETKEDLEHNGSGDRVKHETKKTITSEFKFKPGIFHSLFSEPELELNLKYELISPISVFVSPSEFNVELSISRISSSKIESLLQSLSSQPEPLIWKVEKSSPVAVKYNEVWFRGYAIKKKSGEFVVYLPDTGQTVCVKQSNLRPLSDQAFNYPVCSVQVSLGGVKPLNKEEWGDNACALSRSFLNSENSSLDMIILGREPSGRLSVEILKNGEHSLKDLLIQTKNGESTLIQNCSIDCSFRKYELKESFPNTDTESCITSNSVNPEDTLTATSTVQESASTLSVKTSLGEVSTSEQTPRNPGTTPLKSHAVTTSRREYPENATPMATYRCTVSYVESPDSFYVSPLENQEVWEKILMDIQNPSCCFYTRAEVCYCFYTGTEAICCCFNTVTQVSCCCSNSGAEVSCCCFNTVTQVSCCCFYTGTEVSCCCFYTSTEVSCCCSNTGTEVSCCFHTRAEVCCCSYTGTKISCCSNTGKEFSCYSYTTKYGNIPLHCLLRRVS
ncbi:uncharacterized protein LOC111702954 isoform X3 [Eurytemora carolleeae]|uniref:uncharacterized protein LOC111702954 isoform X3 n=1 Tax=Eurytemora carolleeae TaxID=1294199 RepID=UPI000C75BC69|nr:uncharacterized protein LOC111702954 isoform X3 [Eurytemora carolleeae]|eukprot:XP_023330548.1 uncharacterized protein LOC111702954 isoform X3 [Eurytemora affinis]